MPFGHTRGLAKTKRGRCRTILWAIGLLTAPLALLPVPAPSLSFARFAFPPIATRELHIAELSDRLDLATHATLLHVAIRQACCLMLHFLDEGVRLGRKNGILRDLKQSLVKRSHRVSAEVEAIQPEETVAIALEYLLPLNILGLQINPVI